MSSRTSYSLFLLIVTGLAGYRTSAPAQGRVTSARLAAEPCDIYAAAGTPCVAAHSTTRALYAGYRGPLYQVKRVGSGLTLDIHLAKHGANASTSYADAAAQDAFCSQELCVINVIYDQSGRGNHLYQAAPGTFKGPAKGAFDTQPIADMAAVTVRGHKVYGVYIMPGMGLRNNDASYLPTGDEPQGIYYVVDGTHYDNGCCFDYGNASTNGRAVGTGTMDTTYFGTSTVWGKGAGAGPWIMTDMEAGLFSGHAAKQNVADPTVDGWRYVTAVVDGGGGNQWDLRGGNAQQGKLSTFYSGVRPDPNTSGSYFPMRRKGGVLLGTGGDNGNGSSGTFYEGVVTAGRPSEIATDAVQANIVAARYGVSPVTITRLRRFTNDSSQDVTVTFTNPEDTPVSKVRVRLSLPGAQWKAAPGTSEMTSAQLAKGIAPGSSADFTFKITSPNRTDSGSLIATAEWTMSSGVQLRETAVQRMRSAPAVKLNEFLLGTAADHAGQFIELYNASERVVDISGWKVIHVASQWAPTVLDTFPSKTLMPPHTFYLLEVSTSGLVAPTAAGTSVVNLRSMSGLAAGQTIDVEGETRTIREMGTAAEAMTTLFIPVSTGPRMTVPAGATNLPVTSAVGFAEGQKIGIDAGKHYELATVTSVGKASTQTTLAATASAGETHIDVEVGTNILPGDTLTVDTGQRKEFVKVGTLEATGGRFNIALLSPLKLQHLSGIDVSDRGTGISFSPATKFVHESGDALQALGKSTLVDRPFLQAHGFGAPVVTAESEHQQATATHRWMGTPLSVSGGSIALMDAGGSTVVDAIVYGSQQSNSSANGIITSPELAVMEGEQGGGGCIVVVSSATRSPATSIGRYPDGADTDSNCTDFHTQAAANIMIDLPTGATNIKVSSVAGFGAGQHVLVGSGPTSEDTSIASVGTAGGTVLTARTLAGTTVLPVSHTDGFLAGESIVIGTGEDMETATVVGGTRRSATAITVSAPLKREHASGVTVSGTGISLTMGIHSAHAAGEVITTSRPTPGQPNRN